jgi:F-type H+-transporting ATPase subunit gamma
MGAQLRVLRRRIRSVESTKKITRAQELIAASRIVKAQGRLDASRPYFQALVRALSAAVSNTTVDHPLLTPREAKRAAVVVFTADRGFAGAYSANTIREARALLTLLEEQGMETDLYVVGQKGIQYFTFRGRQLAGSWSGFTEEPQYTDASVIGDVLIESFLLGSENGGVDQIHGVGHLFINRVNQQPTARRILPIEVQVQEVETTVRGSGEAEPQDGSDQRFPLYEFEPSAEGVLDSLLPRYVRWFISSALLHAAASEHAARQRAMKSATDNAEDLIKTLSRQANQARQAEITQEISEIVGGADALAAAAAGSE